jgi:membrane-associated phospholipid phosphatase
MDESCTATTAPRRSPRWRSLWLVPGLPALVLAVLTINVLVTGPLVAADQRVHTTVQALGQSPSWTWLQRPSELIVELADPRVAVFLLAACALAVCARRRSLRPILTAAVAVVLLLVTVIPGKILIGRLGPGRVRPLAGGAGSFPSGHTTTASVCAVLIVVLLLPYLPAWTRRAALAAPPVWGLLVGAALVWRNYHWCTDVVAGWALAVIIIQATLRLTRGGPSRLPAPPAVPDERVASPTAT